MALTRGAHKLHQLFQSAYANNHALSALLGHSPRHFSINNHQSSTPGDSSAGVSYGKLMGINENTLKTDVITLLEGCNLTLDDIKVTYDRMFYPIDMLLRFPSMSEYNAAMREITRKGRLYRLDLVNRQQWDRVTPPDGSYVILQGIPPNAFSDDVERFLSGCNYDAASLNMFYKRGPEVVRMAEVRFASQIEAMNAVIQKNGNFCLNNRISVRVLQ